MVKKQTPETTLGKEVTHIRTLIHKHKLAAVLLTALVTVLLLMALVRLYERTEDTTVTEHNGVYDLTGITGLSTAAVRLMPGDAYYPNTYLTPEDAAAVPESTSRFDEIRADFLSQRFTLLLPDDSVYTMTFRLSGRHALRVYVNGALTGQTGRLGTTKQATEVWENNLTVSAVPRDGKMEIILQSAQFYHAGRGATLAELMIGRQGVSTDPFAEGRTKGLLVMGGLVGAAISLLGIYLLLARTKATLYFALACVAMALREAIQSQAWTYFPLSGNLSFQLEYFSVVLLTVFLTLYLEQYTDNRLLKSLYVTALAGSGIYGVCVLFGDSLFYTSVLVFYQVLLILTIIPAVAGLFYKMQNPSREQAAALYGMAVFFMSAVADIFMYLDLFGETETNLPVSEASMLIFAVAQTFSLYLMNSRVLLEAKEAEQALTLEKAALEGLNRMKTEFWGNASHEMRTPLTVISVNVQTVAEMLKDTEEAAQYGEATELLQSAQAEIMRLTRMVSGMLSLSFLREKTDKQAVDLSALLHSSADIFFLHLQKRGNLLKAEVAEGLTVFGNADLLAQVAANLLQNAATYTEQGEVTLQAQKTGHEILVQVRDTGTGICAELLPRVFERGVSTGGTGFGLYLCKTVVESHGGQIWIESTEGGGTLAAFTLPVYEGQFGGEKHG